MTELGIKFAADVEDIVAGQLAAHLHVGRAAVGPSEHSGENFLPSLEFLKHRQREADVLPIVKNDSELDQLLGVWHRQLAIEQCIEQRKNGGARTNAQGKSQDRNGSKRRALAQHAQAVAHVLNQRSHAGPAISQQLEWANRTARRMSQSNSCDSFGFIVDYLQSVGETQKIEQPKEATQQP